MPTAITIEAPRQDDLLDLLRQSDEYAAALYPPESCYLLDIAELEAPNVSVFAARVDATGATSAVGSSPAVGIAALVLNEDGTAELKRVFVAPSARGRGVARGILRSVEDFARQRNVTVIRLETGPAQPEAISLYEKTGYRHIPQFGQYVGDELSVCMEKTLG